MNGESKIKKILFNEVALFIAVGAFIWNAYGAFNNPQNEIRNELASLTAKVETSQTITEKLQNIKDNDLKELHLSMQRLEERQLDIIKAIVRLETLIKQQ